MALIRGVHSDPVAQRERASTAWGLTSESLMCKGGKVILRMNLCQRFGLVNGSVGEIKDICFAPGSGPPNLPEFVMVYFKDYTGPNLFKDKKYEKWIPIIPFEAKWLGGKKARTRKNLPLSLEWGMTVHKSQGLTLDKIFVNLGYREDSDGGLTFVAISRVKCIEDLYLSEIGWTRLDQINQKQMIRGRKREE